MDGGGAIVRHVSTVEAILDGNLADNDRSNIDNGRWTTNESMKCGGGDER